MARLKVRVEAERYSTGKLDKIIIHRRPKLAIQYEYDSLGMIRAMEFEGRKIPEDAELIKIIMGREIEVVRREKNRLTELDNLRGEDNTEVSTDSAVYVLLKTVVLYNRTEEKPLAEILYNAKDPGIYENSRIKITTQIKGESEITQLEENPPDDYDERILTLPEELSGITVTTRVYTRANGAGGNQTYNKELKLYGPDTSEIIFEEEG